MADLNFNEKQAIEKLFRMPTGYVLGFSDTTFQTFIGESVGIDIHSEKYVVNEGRSKAKKFRVFLKKESDYTVAKVLGDLLEYYTINYVNDGEEMSPDYSAVERIVNRLKAKQPAPEIAAITGKENEKEFKLLCESIREGIEKNRPEGEIDRLHTFVFKFLRRLLDEHKIPYTKEETLNAIFGKYVKHVKDNKLVESEMSITILKYSISILSAFNDVRNNKSLAHENDVLNYDEAILIFNNVANSVSFIQKIEDQYRNSKTIRDAEKIRQGWKNLTGDDLPF